MKLHWFDYDLRQINLKGEPKFRSETIDRMIDLERKSAYLHQLVRWGDRAGAISRVDFQAAASNRCRPHFHRVPY